MLVLGGAWHGMLGIEHSVEMAGEPGLDLFRWVSKGCFEGAHCELPGPGSTFGGQGHDCCFELIFGGFVRDGIHIRFEVNWQFTHFPCGPAVVSVNSLDDAFVNVGSDEWHKWEDCGVRCPCIRSQWDRVLNGRGIS